MLFEKIKKHKELSKLIIEKCEENKICVDIDEKIDRKNVLILKPDNFYKSLNIANTPKSVDCLLILRCKERGYSMTLAELKNINSPDYGFSVTDLYQKFETIFNDFIPIKFEGILDERYRRIELYFVSKINIYKRDAGLSLKLSQKKFTFNGKKYFIKPQMPTPAVKPCY